MFRRFGISALLTLALAHNAIAQETKTISIEPQDLAAAVRNLAEQTGVQVLFAAEDLKGLQSKALQGSMTVEEALRRLLAGTGYTFKATGPNTYVIERTAEASAKPTELPEVTVTASPPAGYYVPDAATATKTDTPIKDVPQSIEVRDRQLLDDLGGSHNVYEVGKTVAGVLDYSHGNGSPGINVPTFTIRGFSSSYLRDGALRLNGWLYTMDMADIDRVEFLKGPASVLYGSAGFTGNYGGLVNYVSKRPLAGPLTDIETVVGSYDYYRGSLDFNQALNVDKTLLFRFNGAITDAGSFVDEAHTRTGLVAPALSYQLSPRDSLTLLTEYVKSRATPVTGLPLTTDSFDVPYHRNFVDPNFAHIDIDSPNLFLNYDHRYNGDWKFVMDSSVGYGRTHDFENGMFFDSGGTNTWQLTGSHWEFWNTSVSVDTRLEGRLESGGLDHRLLFGLNLQYEGYKTTGTFGPNLDLGGGSLPGLPPPPDGAFEAVWNGGPLATLFYHEYQQYLAPYVQDLFGVGEKVKILAGVRYDTMNVNAGISPNFGTGNPQFDQIAQHSDHLSPRAGIVWQPVKPTSVYASYSQGFVPNLGFTRTSSQIPPELGESIETGIKQQLARALDAHLAVYRITQKNVTDSDPTNTPSENYLIVLGKTRSQGVELDVNGQITESFRVTAAAAWMRAWVLQGNSSIPSGNHLGNAPPRTFNLFGVYSFPGAFTGLELGAGFYYASRMFSDSAETLHMPELLQLDSMIAYRFNPRWRVQVDMKNLTSRHNYTTDYGNVVNRGQPFSIYASVKASF
ncbi:MAG TPA: TonB-dependent receptor [Nitrospiria bacterium]|nr:TonB-dependent receptor [Nitrospiria bacterium]